MGSSALAFRWESAPQVQEPRLRALPRHYYAFENTIYEVAFHEPNGIARRIPEALVQDLWLHQRFATSDLVTSSGERLTVLDPGRLNTDAGPDFKGARVRIGDVEWAGDVEIHVCSGGWFDHAHHLDTGYDGVVLHVALHADLWTGGLLRPDGSTLPELILFEHLDTPLRRLLHQFYTRPGDDILCAPEWQRVPESIRRAWVRALARERLRQKRDRLAQRFLHVPTLDQLCYEQLFAGLGYAKNDGPMRDLARRLPLGLLRQFDDRQDLEAILLGVAGLLPTPADLLDADRTTADYAMGLRDRFERLNLYLGLPVMDSTAWRFFRLRPANFPPLRLAQGAAWLAPCGLLRHDPLGALLRAMQAEEPVPALRRLLSAAPSPFWETHVRLEKATKPRNANIGVQRADALIVNAVVPLLLLHAEQTGDPALEEAAYEVLGQVPAPRDEVTRRYAALGTRPDDAFTAQGLHQLFRTRCTEARCLTCAIGQNLLDRVETA